jgi:hypothetical protein
MEQQRRFTILEKVDADVAYDQWLFTDEPFLNELCLMLLVAVRHQVEQELMRLSARVNDDAVTSIREHQKAAQDERQQWNTRDGKKKIITRLKLESISGWKSSMRTLQLVADNYKHSPLLKPDKKLLDHLGLDQTVTYGPLPESGRLREGLAAKINLPKDSSYCDIVEEFLIRAEQFLEEVKKLNGLSKARWYRLSYEDFCE